MNEHKKIEDQSSENGRGYEVRDANTKAVTLFGVGLAVLIVVAMFVLILLIDFFESKKESDSPVPSPFVVERPLPPQPRLQVAPEMDWEQFRSSEDSMLHNYGMLFPEAGVVRIPIDRAMELLAERGLPARDTTAQVMGEQKQ